MGNAIRGCLSSRALVPVKDLASGIGDPAVRWPQPTHHPQTSSGTIQWSSRGLGTPLPGYSRQASRNPISGYRRPLPRPHALARHGSRSVAVVGLYSTIWRVLGASNRYSMWAHNLQSDYAVITAGCQEARISRAPGHRITPRSVTVQLCDRVSAVLVPDEHRSICHGPVSYYGESQDVVTVTLPSEPLMTKFSFAPPKSLLMRYSPPL